MHTRKRLDAAGIKGDAILHLRNDIKRGGGKRTRMGNVEESEAMTAVFYAPVPMESDSEEMKDTINII